MRWLILKSSLRNCYWDRIQIIITGESIISSRAWRWRIFEERKCRGKCTLQAYTVLYLCGVGPWVRGEIVYRGWMSRYSGQATRYRCICRWCMDVCILWFHLFLWRLKLWHHELSSDYFEQHVSSITIIIFNIIFNIISGFDIMFTFQDHAELLVGDHPQFTCLVAHNQDRTRTSPRITTLSLAIIEGAATCLVSIMTVTHKLTDLPENSLVQFDFLSTLPPTPLWSPYHHSKHSSPNSLQHSIVNNIPTRKRSISSLLDASIFTFDHLTPINLVCLPKSWPHRLLPNSDANHWLPPRSCLLQSTSSLRTL